MKICICCSLSFTDEVFAITKELEKLGHEVLLPNGIINRLIEKEDFDPIKAKTETNAVKNHIEKIRKADAVLVCNYTKNGVKNYIGANTFLEISFAYYFDKPIYSLNSLPDFDYINDEIQSFNIININNDLSLIQK